MKIFLLRPLVLISIILGCLFLSSCTNTAQPTSTNISLDWSLTKNAIEPSVNSEATFTIYNNGNNTIEKGWEIYFSTIYLPNDVKTQTDGFKIEHLSGDFFRMYASNNDKEIAAGESLSISYSSKRYLLKNSHVPKAPFIVLAGTNNGIPITDYSKSHIELKDHVEAYEPSDSPITFPTAENLFRESNNLSLISSENINPIIPTPVTLIKGNGYFNLSDEILIYSDPEFEKEKNWLERYLPSVFRGRISTSSNSKDALISLIYDKNISSQDAYSLIIGDSNIEIKSSTTSGAFYGLQSLIALLPLNAFEKTQTTLTFHKVEIKDQARFPHRGLFLDIARNFQQKKDILKLIDVMAFYKLNVLQLHLANDEGWRIDIPGLPELVEVGSKRGFAKHEEGIVWPYYGSGPNAENSLYGSGHLTKSDFIEILQYAHTRHVQVIPEIVAPAHMKAAIISMNKRYENYKAKGDLAKAEEYLLVHPDDTSTYTSVQRYKNNTMDVCMESSFTFYEKVLDEILLMYKEAEVPISTFHVGGDEVPRGVWEGSPACAELIAQNNEIGSTADLHNYYYTRLSDLLAQKDLNLAGWEEVGQTIAEINGRSTHIPNQELLGKNIRLHAWNAVVGWGGTDMAYKLANTGYEVVLSNSSNLYFDLAYDRDPNEPGLHWSGFVNLKSAWQMTPFNNVISNDYDIYGNKVDVEKFASTQVQLTEAGKKRIIGLQGQLWSETINGPNMMFYYLLPKMLGLAERAWAADPKWSTIKNADKRNEMMLDDWNQFANTVGQIEFPRLDYLNGGYSTRLPKPGATLVDNTLRANVESPGLIIRYTLDGSEPTKNDPVYTAPIKIENLSTTKVILLKSFTPSGKSSSGITELIVKN